jgi:type II secretory pathway pseudopilin PulG
MPSSERAAKTSTFPVAAPAEASAARPKRPRRLGKWQARAYTVVALAIGVTLMNIAVAAALPAWSHMVQHDKEEELIFRGLQIAEAIRVFQIRFGRYPINLKELMDTEPRSIRQLWANPMREDGRWGLIPVGIVPGTPGAQGLPGVPLEPGKGAQNPAQGQPGQPGLPLPPGEEGEAPGVILSERFDQPEIGKVTNNLPIRGVFSPGKENAIHSFLGKTAVSEWHFTVELASFQQQGTPDDPAFVRPFPAWQIGKPFPDGITPLIPQPTANPSPGGMPQQPPGQPGGTTANPANPSGERFPHLGNDGSGRDLRPLPGTKTPNSFGGNG